MWRCCVDGTAGGFENFSSLAFRAPSAAASLTFRRENLGGLNIGVDGPKRFSSETDGSDGSVGF